METAEHFGVGTTAISNWVRRAREGGRSALSSKKGGRRPIEQMALTSRQRAQITRLVREKNPATSCI